MNNAWKDYHYKGWIIQASEYYNDWECFPATTDSEIDENFKNKEDIRFNKLKEAKAWIKTDEAKKLLEKYLG